MTRIIISKIRISKIRRKRRRRKMRIREDINNFCLLMTTSLALLLPLLFGVCSININIIIIGFAGSILPGAVIFVDAGAAFFFADFRIGSAVRGSVNRFV